MATEKFEGKKLKFVLIGDGSTEICKKFIQKALIREESFDYIPIVFEARLYDIKVDEKNYELEIWCVAGQDDYERLRPTAYPNTDCLIICYSTWNFESLEKVKTFWMPEIKFHCPNVPFIFVGTRVDKRERFRNHPETLNLIVEEETGQEVSRVNKARGHIECSTVEDFNIENVFEMAVRATRIKTENWKRQKCEIS